MRTGVTTAADLASLLPDEAVAMMTRVTGEDDFLLRVVAPEIEDYEDFLLHTLTRIECVSKVKSAFVLSTLKREARLPLPESP